LCCGVGSLIIFMLGQPAFAQCMTFRELPELPMVESFVLKQMQGDELDIFAEGEICSGTTESFRNFVTRNDIVEATVHFNSPGGALFEGLLLGDAIRELGFDTRISEFNAVLRRWDKTQAGPIKQPLCASACAYAFVGGRYRYFDSRDGQRLGVHQFATVDGTETSSDAQIASGLIVAYLQRMGASPIGFSVAASASSDEMVWLTPAQAVELDWSNNGRLPTQVEIKVLDARPYLRLEQITKQGAVRVLLICQGTQINILAGVFADYSRSMQMAVPGKERSYLSVGAKEYFSGPFASDRFDIGSGGLFFQRRVDKSDWLLLAEEDRIGVKFEVGRDFSYGNEIELKPVRSEVRRFVADC